MIKILLLIGEKYWKDIQTNATKPAVPLRSKSTVPSPLKPAVPLSSKPAVPSPSRPTVPSPSKPTEPPPSKPTVFPTSTPSVTTMTKKDETLSILIKNIKPPLVDQKISISDYAPTSSPLILPFIFSCVTEIEKRKLDVEGIYHVQNSNVEAWNIINHHLKTKKIPYMENIKDINLICACLYVYMSVFQEPLITNLLRDDFIRAAEDIHQQKGLTNLDQTLVKLPPVNRQTLAFLLSHMIRVQKWIHDTFLTWFFGPFIFGKTTLSDKTYHDHRKYYFVLSAMMKLEEGYWAKGNI